MRFFNQAVPKFKIINESFTHQQILYKLSLTSLQITSGIHHCFL